jgi:hypothetical protein
MRKLYLIGFEFDMGLLHLYREEFGNNKFGRILAFKDSGSADMFIHHRTDSSAFNFREFPIDIDELEIHDFKVVEVKEVVGIRVEEEVENE